MNRDSCFSLAAAVNHTSTWLHLNPWVQISSLIAIWDLQFRLVSEPFPTLGDSTNRRFKLGGRFNTQQPAGRRTCRFLEATGSAYLLRAFPEVPTIHLI